MAKYRLIVANWLSHRYRPHVYGTRSTGTGRQRKRHYDQGGDPWASRGRKIV